VTATGAAFLAVALMLAGLTAALRLARGGRTAYRRRLFLLTPAEADFHQVLRSVLAGDWHVFAQVRVADLVSITGRSIQARRVALNKVSSKSVDYVVCDPQFRPRLIIELNDRTHDLESRRQRDQFVAQVCQWAELPLVFAANRRPFDAHAIRALLADNDVATRPQRAAIHLRYAGSGEKRPNEWERRP
jgi:hypothetical protein